MPSRFSRRGRIRGVSTFRRRGHYRRGPSGQRVWVSSHKVTRGSKASPPRIKVQRVDTVPALRASNLSRNRQDIDKHPAARVETDRWADPNAKCPLCGAAVYFFADRFGGRVYFDEVGPPWPKHPCPLDTRVASPGRAVSPSFSEKRLRRVNTRSAQHSSPTQGPATRSSIVVQSWHYSGRTLVEVRQPGEGADTELWVIPQGLVFESGQVLFRVENRFSYLNTRRLQALTVEIDSTYLLQTKPAGPATSESVGASLTAPPTSDPPSPDAAEQLDEQLQVPTTASQDEASAGGCLLILALGAFLVGVLILVTAEDLDAPDWVASSLVVASVVGAYLGLALIHRSSVRSSRRD